MSLARLASSPSISRAGARREPGAPLSAFDGVTLLEIVQRSVHHVSDFPLTTGERGNVGFELRAGALVDVDGLGAGRAGDVERDLCLLFTLFDQGRRAGLPGIAIRRQLHG
jgi:hypothetical protein